MIKGFTPARTLCGSNYDKLLIPVEKVHPFPNMVLRMSYPLITSLDCVLSDTKVINLNHREDYEYVWSVDSSDEVLRKLALDNKNSRLDLPLDFFDSQNIVVKIIATSGIYDISKENSFKIQSITMSVAEIGFNYGEEIIIKASEEIRLEARIVSACSLVGNITYNWSYSSVDVLNMTKILQSQPNNYTLLLKPRTLKPGFSYTFTANLTFNNKTYLGKASSKIIVEEDPMILTFSCWGSTIGTSNDLIVKAIASDPSRSTYKMTFLWTCSDGSQPCVYSDNKTQFTSYDGNTLKISASKLKDGAIYLFKVIANNDFKSKTKEIEFRVDKNIKNIVEIPEINGIFFDTANINFIPTNNICPNCKYTWSVYPELQMSNSILAPSPMLTVPVAPMKANTCYQFTLTSSVSKSFVTTTLLCRQKAPICTSINTTDNFDSVLVDAYGCTAHGQSLLYQYGFVNITGKNIWTTPQTSLPYGKVFNGNFKTIVVRICSKYECIIYESPISTIVRKLTPSNYWVNIMNPSDIPGASICYSQEVTSIAEFSQIPQIVYDYFVTQSYTPSMINLMLSTLQILCESQYNDENSLEILRNLLSFATHKYKTLTTDQISQNLIIFEYTINMENTDILTTSINNIINLWASNAIPENSPIVIKGIISLSAQRFYASDLPGLALNISQGILYIPENLTIDSSMIVDIVYKKYNFYNNVIVEIIFYNSGEYKNGVLELKNKREILDSISDSAFEVLLFGDFNMDHEIMCDVYTVNNTWDGSGCDVMEKDKSQVLISSFDIRKFKVVDYRNSCDTGVGPVIAMGLTIMGACVFAILVCYYDASYKEIIEPTNFSIIYPYTSCLKRQNSHKRFQLTLQILCNFLILYCLIGVFENAFHSPETTNTENYGLYNKNSIQAGAAAWGLCQIFIFPCFIYNSFTTHKLISRIIHFFICITLVSSSIIGIIYMTAAYCANYMFYWIINILIFVPIQIVLEIPYAVFVKFIVFKKFDPNAVEKSSKIDTVNSKNNSDKKNEEEGKYDDHEDKSVELKENDPLKNDMNFRGGRYIQGTDHEGEKPER